MDTKNVSLGLMHAKCVSKYVPNVYLKVQLCSEEKKIQANIFLQDV